MGIHCEIGLNQPVGGVYRPGNIVSGSIKFAVDKVTEFTKITVSLKGYALLQVIVSRGQQSSTYVNQEQIIDCDTDVRGKYENTFTMKVGSEEIPFLYTLPVNIPSSLLYKKSHGNETIYSKIFYYVRVKFDRPGLFERTKRFKMEIPVLSGILPILSREPTIGGEKKKLFNIYFENHVINLKAVVQNSIIETGGKVYFNCEVENLTNITIKALEISLQEVYRFVKSEKNLSTVLESVKSTESITCTIEAGKNKTFDFIIDVPNDKVSLEHSRIISRQYCVQMLAKLPIPNRNLVLRIPLQIGEVIESEMHLEPKLIAHGVNVENGGASSSGEPPTYWEAMSEEKIDLFANLGDGTKRSQ